MIRVKLVEGEFGSDVHIEKPYDGFERIVDDTYLLSTTDPYRSHGVFQTAALTGATTTTIIEAEEAGSIVLTDLVVSAKKKAASTLTIQFNDGTNQAVLVAPDTVESAVNLSWSPQGRIQGWRDAYIEAITTGAADVTITAGYVRVAVGLPFGEWDAHR